MSRHEEGLPADDEPLARPFVQRPAPSGPPGDASGPDPWATADPRPAANPWAPARDPWTWGPDAGLWGTEAPPADAPVVSEDIRPYLLTGGRTAARGPAVAIETVVLATGLRPDRQPAASAAERARILALAHRPCSAAEVAAHLHLPLQVALVLVTDLVAEGLLDASVAERDPSNDVVLLERLIAGVAAL